MIILIDLTCLSYHMTGIERYALCITKEMIIQDHKNKYILLFRDEVFHELKPFVDRKKIIAKIIYGNHKQVFNLFVLPCELKKIKADAYLFFASRNPLLFRRKGIYCTIHDLVCWDYPETTRRLQRLYSKIANKNAARVAEHIFTVSEFSRGRINKLLNIPLDRITVTYNGISDSLSKENYANYEIVRKKYNLPEKYIMNLSTLEPRKNLPLLLKCFDQISDQVDYDIVLVGRKGWKIDEFLQGIKSNERVHITGFVEDREVIQIYKHTLCFVFTSVYEGFGIPPIEALYFGTPVLSSDAAALPEVLRNKANYFESMNEEDLKRKLLTIEKDSKVMPRELDDFQKSMFQFSVSAKRIIKVLSDSRK